MDNARINSAKYANKEKTLIDLNLTINGETFDFTYGEWDTGPLTLELTKIKDKWPEVQSCISNGPEQSVASDENVNVPTI